MISFDFSYKVFVVLFFILLIILELKTRIFLYLIGSYYSKLNILLVIKPSISCFCDTSNNLLGVVIRPSLYSFKDNSKSNSSLLVRNIDNSIMFYKTVLILLSRGLYSAGCV
jgi:hypothetical protein